MKKPSESKDPNPRISGLKNLLNSIDQELDQIQQDLAPQPATDPTKVAPEDPDVKLDLPCGFYVKLNASSTRATLHLLPSAKRDALFNIKGSDLIHWLKDSGITYGILEKNIQKLVSFLRETPFTDVDVVVALGQEPTEPGKPFTDYWIGDHVTVRAGEPPPVRENDLLMRILPAMEGVPGVNVFGESISPGSTPPLIITAGKNVSEREPGAFYADCSGNVRFESDRLIVEEEHRDAQCTLGISDDSQYAWINIEPAMGNGRPLTYRAIMNSLSEKGVCAGIDESAIKQAVNQARTASTLLEKIVIARGRESTRGTDGNIEWHIHPLAPPTRFVIDEHGNVDFHVVQDMRCVKDGDHLATVILPTRGGDGVNVLGERLEGIWGKPLPVRPQDNITVKEEGTKWYAGCSGLYLLENNRLSVQPFYEVSGDVDYTTGNIDFLGDILVQGNVFDGFKVKASGNVTVLGTIEAAEVEAGRNVEVRNGIFGKEKGKVVAGKDVISNFMQNANVEAARDVIVGNQILNSTVCARRNIELKQGKGCIVGGAAYAGFEISAKILGTEYGTRTRIEVGIDFAALQQMMNVSKQLKMLQSHFDELTKFLQKVLMSKDDQETVDKNSQLLLQAQAKKFKLQNSISRLDQLYQRLARQVHVTDTPRIIATSGVMPGVLIKIHEKQQKIPFPMDSTIITYDPKQEAILFEKFGK